MIQHPREEPVIAGEPATEHLFGVMLKAPHHVLPAPCAVSTHGCRLGAGYEQP
jgi:hypothetical protein